MCDLYLEGPDEKCVTLLFVQHFICADVTRKPFFLNFESSQVNFKERANVETGRNIFNLQNAITSAFLPHFAPSNNLF